MENVILDQNKEEKVWVKPKLSSKIACSSFRVSGIISAKFLKTIATNIHEINIHFLDWSIN